MVSSEGVTNLLGSLFSGTVATMFWVFIVTLVVGIAGGTAWYFGFYRKKFDIIIKIISRRSGDNKEFFDKGAILYDTKNQTRYLKLLKTGVELELPKFMVLRHTNWGDYIEIHRESELGFSFLTPPKIDREYYIGVNGKKYPYKDLKQRNIESDIAFILRRQKDNKKMIDPESILMKLLAYAPQIVGSIVMLMILYVVLDGAPALLEAMQQAAKEFRGANANNPTIISSVFLYLGSKFKWKMKQ